MESSCDGSVLLVGDGDFSFSLSLLKHGRLSPAQVTTSNLETSETIQHHKLAKNNMCELENKGARVLLEVDARELHNHPVINQNLYLRIIFNFPLADRHNIKKNRALLADFFSSCSQVLAPGGHVMVTLCKGQGGTPADRPQRSWHDSWQALAMAANAGFVLADIFHFEADSFPEYHSVGFRFQDKSFDTEGSLVHVFEKANMVSVVESVVARGSVELGGTTYSCSHYIAEKLKRNLLEEEDSPIGWVKKELELSLGQCFSSTKLPSGYLDAVLPGYKSSVCIGSSTAESDAGVEGLHSLGTISDLPTGSGDGDALTEIKKQKDDDNLMRKRELASLQFAHGVGESEETRQSTSNSSDCLPLLTQFIPDNNESVYVFIKSSAKTGQQDNEVNIETESESNDQRVVDQDSVSCAADFSEDNEQPVADCDKVFHHRVSLLESLTSLCSVLSENSGETQNLSSTGAHLLAAQEVSDADLSVGHSITVAGQCCRPRPIVSNTLQVYHELGFIHKLSSVSEDLAESAVCGNNNTDFEMISSSLLSCLQKSTVFRDNSLLETHPCPNSNKVMVEGMLEIKVVKLVYRKEIQTDSVSQPIGIILKATSHGSHQFLVSILHLDSIICQARNIPDPRLLWSDSSKVLDQLKMFAALHPSVSHDQYQAVSLYPMKFLHDLSFWESSTQQFDETELLEVIRYVAQDCVVKVSLMDKYAEPETGRTSRCYRLHFQSHSLAFPYSMSWKLQSLIRIEVARRLDVVLR
ncbi:ferredoxin-fold anticodon-binding domain-containing protein 1-like [Elysia marginata]|uniref:Ferredoxin-fold anticodon-binding domain-containing protein 1-like n=1 Tax=Elysia marginata TaxID=1093978 RepID=A0AAV4FDX8_9GAST|nr:ferredoxin-fold anticodon-binding domain-containing protein 1-like [Elysia marginata]